MKNNVSRTFVTHSQELIDIKTGEIYQTERTTKTIHEKEPDFVKLYINTLLVFKELPKTLNPILISLLGYMTYADSDKENGGQIIVINGFIKKEIANRLDIKVNTIDKALTSFVKKSIFKRLGTGTYQVNPYIFGRGDWINIKSIQSKFNFNTGEILSDIERESDG